MRQITGAEFDAEVIGSKQPVVVDFYTDDCPPCRALSPVLQQWEEDSNGAYKVVKVDAAVEQSLAASYGVRAVPSLFLFSNGKCVGQTVGLKSKGNMQKWVSESLQQA